MISIGVDKVDFENIAATAGTLEVVRYFAHVDLQNDFEKVDSLNDLAYADFPNDLAPIDLRHFELVVHACCVVLLNVHSHGFHSKMSLLDYLKKTNHLDS